MASLTLVASLVVVGAAQTSGDPSGYLGRWNITGTADSSAVFWLEVSQDNGTLS